MKKILLLLVLLISILTFAQKKKSSKKGSSNTTTTSLLAKADNLSVEMQKKDFVVAINNKTAVKDTILLSKFDNKPAPIDCKIQAFSAKGTQLYLVSWIEKSKIETKLSTEDIVTTNSVIINVANKSKVLSNKQLSSDIKLISYLDAKQTVSETIQKKHNEGFQLILLPDGDITKKSKTKDIRLMYSPTEKIYVNYKK